MKQSALFQGFPSVEAIPKPHRRVGAVREVQSGPGNQFGVGAHGRPSSGVVYLPFESSHDLVAMGFGVEFISHLDEQCHVLIRAEACIQAQLYFDRFRVGGIVRILAEQTLVQGSQLGLLVAPLGRGLVQPALGFLPGRRSTDCAFHGRLQAASGLGQAAGRSFFPRAWSGSPFPAHLLKLSLLQLLLRLCQPLFGPLHGLLLRFASLASLSHLLLEGVNALAEQFGVLSRPSLQTSLGDQHERFGLRASNGISWVMGHRQPHRPYVGLAKLTTPAW